MSNKDGITNDLLHYELEQSRESLNFALKSAGMGTWDIDLVNDTVQCSKEMLDLWEVGPEEFNGQRSILQSKVHPDDVENMRKAIDTAIQNRSIYELEYRILLSNQVQRWVKSRGRCTYAHHSDVPVRFSGVVFDITESKIKEAELEAAIKEREQFLTIASHELRTPLTCLQLQLLVMEWELKEKYNQFYDSERIETGFKKQKEQLVRLTRIIDNIFDQSKVSDEGFSFKIESFDLIALTHDVVERFRTISRSADASEISFIKRRESIIGEWDKFRIEQVLINLLSNALRYGNKKRIHVEIGAYAEEVHIKIRDEGPGIKEEDQERIFERFGRSSINNEMGGIGLGLYLSKNIVLSHGGQILLKSEPGKGSEFTVILPIHSPNTP